CCLRLARSKEGVMHFSPPRIPVGAPDSWRSVRWLCTCALAMGLVPVVGGTAWSHEPLSAPDPASAAAARPAMKEAIALLDLKYVFDHYPSFVRAKSDMQIEIQISETMVVLRKASVEKLQKDRQHQTPGSDAHRRLTDLLKSESTQLEAQVETLREQFIR